MIVDASALLAILLDEDDGPTFSDRITESSDPCLLSPVNYLECCLRIDRFSDGARSDRIDESLAIMGIELVPVTPREARLAREAYRNYGKGDHPARLNLGDCFAYALAKARGEALLFKGDDFRKTDVKAAL